MSAKVPVLIVQGRENRIAPPQPAREFVDALDAPWKRFVEIKGGHFACFTNPPNSSGGARPVEVLIAT